jgi:membrane protein
LAALLIWLYYSALVFVFGAELTKAYADRYGAGTIPSARAEYVRGGSGIHHAPGS